MLSPLHHPCSPRKGSKGGYRGFFSKKIFGNFVGTLETVRNTVRIREVSVPRGSTVHYLTRVYLVAFLVLTHSSSLGLKKNNEAITVLALAKSILFKGCVLCSTLILVLTHSSSLAHIKNFKAKWFGISLVFIK